MSSLTNDLQKIYLTKLQIKEVIGTDSDVFEDYPELISDAISEGGGSGEGLDWDDVAGYGYIIPAGTVTLSSNGTVDVSTYANAYVNVPQSGGEQIDPFWGQYIDIAAAIEDDTFPVTGNCSPGISSDFEYEEENGEVTSVSWNWIFNDNGTDYTIRVVVNSDNSLEGVSTGSIGMAGAIADNLENYPDLYIDDAVYANLTDVTMTKSSDPSEDGYDYLLEGNLWGWNMMNACESVEEITENGFYLNLGQAGFNVNIESEIPSNYIIDIDDFDGDIDNCTDFIDSGDEIPYLVKARIIDNYVFDGVNNTIEYDSDISFNGSSHSAHVTINDVEGDIYGGYFENLPAGDGINLLPVLGGVVIDSAEEGDDYDYYIEAGWIEYFNFEGVGASDVALIGQNGTFDVTTCALAVVDVPGAGEGIIPTGTYNISSNGQYDISTYAYTYVNVSGGGSGSDYEKYTVSDVVEFENDSRFGPYMWYFAANELDGEDDGNPDYATISAGFFSTKYWGYCYPNEFEVEINPVLDMDGEPGLYMVSYTDLVKREYDWNSLPEFNAYRGYTYSYEYANPYYNDENAPEGANTWDETLSYEFNYGGDLLYKTTLNIAQLSDREKAAPNEIINGVWRVFDDSQPGLTGYYDETEYGEGNYVNAQWLSIGCLSPAETDGGPLTQFTTSYHGAASYTTGFDPRTLCGYTWQAVVDGRGWLVDLIDNTGELVFAEMRLSDGDDENAAYLDSDSDEFIQEIELSDSNTTFDGLYIYAVDDSGDYTKNYKLHINDLNAYDLLGDEQITVGASCNADVTIDNGYPYLYVDMSLLNDFYNEWSITLELVVPNTIKFGSEVMLRVTAFTGAKKINRVYSQGSSSQTDFIDQGDGTWLEENVGDQYYPGRVLYEVYADGTSQAYQVSSWDSTNEILQFTEGNQRSYTSYGQAGWDWLWDPENKTLSHVVTE